MKRKLLYAVVLIMISSGAKADYSPTPGTQGALNKGACDQYKQDDRKLNEIYQAILNDKAYVSQTEFLASFKKAEVQWIKYRDAELEALFPGTNKQSEWGSIYPMCACSEMDGLTRQRIEELQHWYIGKEEGDVCGGTEKTKP